MILSSSTVYFAVQSCSNFKYVDVTLVGDHKQSIYLYDMAVVKKTENKRRKPPGELSSISAGRGYSSELKLN